MKPGNPRKKGGLPGFLFRGGGISALVKKGGTTPRKNDRPGEGNGAFGRGKRGLSGTFSGGVQKRVSTPIINKGRNAPNLGYRGIRFLGGLREGFKPPQPGRADKKKNINFRPPEVVFLA